MKLALLALTFVAAASLPSALNSDPTEKVRAGRLEVSREAVEHIVKHETGGRAYFTRFYERPQDPGFASGVTVGFGYDLKFHSKEQIRRDWAGVATPAEIAAMESVAGQDGAQYRRIQHLVHITWDEGQTVFERVTLPRWGDETYRAYRLSEIAPKTLHPHLAGALVGNTFNRGPAIANSNKLREKFQRRELILRHKWEAVPDTFLSEQRLWPGHKGLRQRRLEEYQLAKKALIYKSWQ